MLLPFDDQKDDEEDEDDEEEEDEDEDEEGMEVATRPVCIRSSPVRIELAPEASLSELAEVSETTHTHTPHTMLVCIQWGVHMFQSIVSWCLSPSMLPMSAGGGSLRP